MDPTFGNGEYLIVDELTYHFRPPERGSVLIFKYPRDPKKYFVKRVIGLPGETVEIREGVVNVDGETLREPYVRFEKKDNLTFTLAADEYFVMGDNRLGSADSRIWGILPREDIVGRVFIRMYPLTEIGLFPGKANYSE